MAAAAEMAEVAPAAEMTTRSNRTGCCCVRSCTMSTRSRFMSAKRNGSSNGSSNCSSNASSNGNKSKGNKKQ